MDLIKSYDFFQPENVNGVCEIVGCGSVGSYVATFLARSGIQRFSLWDFDKVESANIVNQMFFQKHVGHPKVDALEELILDINPDARIDKHPRGWNGERLSGYVFLAVDSIELRRKIAQSQLFNHSIKALFDFRTGLTDAQHYACDWHSYDDTQRFLKTTEYTDEEAQIAAPVTACGTTLGVATTVAVITAIGVDNFINWIKHGSLKRFVLVDGFAPYIESF